MVSKTKKEVAEHQISVQEEMQSKGFNIVDCCMCGSTLLYRTSETSIDCLCGKTVNPNDCSDYWYEGLQNNEEFNN